MTEWGFYGREPEIAELRKILRNPNFFTRAVIGRRGVGKSELIREALKAADTGQPSVYMEMTAGPRQNLLDLEVALDGAGIADLPDSDRWKKWRATADPEREGWGHYACTGAFCEAVRDLIAKDVIVVLDEFHHVTEEEGGLGLESSFKRIIDEFRLISGTRAKGKLIVAGSHQQRMRHMLRGDRPLYLRLEAFPVEKLPVADLLWMAAEQGWLRHPSRFLTMYSVYNGIPDLWETYHRENRGPDATEDLDAIGDDDEWYQAFYRKEIERCLKGEGHYRFDDSNHTDLPKIAARILECLADRGSMRVGDMRDILQKKGVNRVNPDMDREEWDEMLESVLHDLSKTIGLIGMAKRGPLGRITGQTTARITDPNTLFQMRVKKAMDGASDPDEELDPDETPDSNLMLAGMTEELDKDEGFALERLTAGWFRGMGFAAGNGFRRGDIEVDAHGYRMTRSKDRASTHREMLVASCKRDFSRLSGRAASDLDGMAEIYGNYWKSRDGKNNEKIRNDPDYDEEFDTLVRYSYDMRKFAVAPVIPEGATLPPMADDMVDIREMARRLDIDPDTGPEPEADHPDGDGPAP